MGGGMGGGMGGMGSGLVASAKMATGNQAMQASKMGGGMVDDTAKQWKLFVGQVGGALCRME